MRRVRIDIVGEPCGTRVVDVKTGEEIHEIRTIALSHTAGEPPQAKIVTWHTTERCLVDGGGVIAVAREITLCPGCHHQVVKQKLPYSLLLIVRILRHRLAWIALGFLLGSVLVMIVR
jgi:hypothetical protein